MKVQNSMIADKISTNRGTSVTTKSYFTSHFLTSYNTVYNLLYSSELKFSSVAWPNKMFSAYQQTNTPQLELSF